MDREFEIALEKPGVDPTEAPEDFEGIGWLVTVLWEGAVEDEWVVETRQKGDRQAAALVEEFDGDPLEVQLTEVYVDPDTIEATGHGPYPRYRANPGLLSRLLGSR